MTRVDFVISNNRHHVAMMRPVLESLAGARDYACRVLSLCEFRGMESPRRAFRDNGVQFSSVVPYNLRWSPSLGRQSRGGAPGPLRRLARDLSWSLLLGRAFRSLLASPPDLAVVPNDAAFPYDRLARLLRGRRIPFLLMQEGIRFPLPAAPPDEDYGQGGADAMAVWGDASASYFAGLGVPTERLFVTGSPRFDGLPGRDDALESDEVRARHGLTGKTLLFITNPVDDQGFCTTQEKVRLVTRFLGEIAPLFDDPEFRVAVKLHARESERAYRAAIAGLPHAGRIGILTDAPLYPLFRAARAAVVLASTVGLEALLFDLPLAVLELPSVGFVYDYVEAGAAQGLTWSSPLAPQVSALMNDEGPSSTERQAYLRRQLATDRMAAREIAALIRDLVERGGNGYRQ